VLGVAENRNIKSREVFMTRTHNMLHSSKNYKLIALGV